MLVLCVETTCDETAAAIVDDAYQVRASVVASQHELHERFGGVVPELASRAHLERLLPVIDEALRQAGVVLAEIDAIAVANTPGLAGSLLVGLSAAKALAVAVDKPLATVNHVEAHIFACRIAAGRDIFPCIGLVASGGHTSLYEVRDPLDFRRLGGTLDDAAGEAFDKVASLLGLAYPGGPAIAAAAEGGNPRAYQLPRSFRGDPTRLDFSFSGLKTAVRYLLHPPSGPPRPALSPRELADLAASFQEAVVDVLVEKSLAALTQTGLSRLAVGGGVAANARLRERLAAETAAAGAQLLLAPLELSTDNAVMGALAIERLRAGLAAPLDAEVAPTLRLPRRAD
ncbi:MAG: tRNA (adenosine(37)-N6)-threonylcarbamoyltransferase complex transferase subunit TsaD [Pirellulales bacterium]|nr:tRNA (adenosine(37)-N6)-threonylcarbamoyltransferase complex transferase subunit TsaD [Pirellulales bacterium]